MGSEILLLPVLLAGLLGSGHCFGMCGGIAGALNTNTTVGATSSLYTANLLYNLGRISSYTLAGAMVGALGFVIGDALDIAYWSVILRIFAGLLIIAIGLQLVFKWRILFWLEWLGLPVWRRIAPLIRRVGQSQSPGKILLLGMLWGWLPCGLVYSILLIALTAGDALSGALVMLVFGIGTLPSMLLTGVTLARIGIWSGKWRLGKAMGILCIVLGVWTAIAPTLHIRGHTDEHPIHAHH